MAKPASLEKMSDEQIEQLAELSHSLVSDPATRRDFQRLMKKKNPNLVVPELDTEDAVAKLKEEQAAELEKIRKETTDDRLAAKRERLQADLKSKYPELAFDDIEKAMIEKTIGSHESAAQFLANERRLAEPSAEVPGRGGPMMMPQEAKQFFKTPTQTARKLARDVVTDLMNKRRRAA